MPIRNHARTADEFRRTAPALPDSMWPKRLAAAITTALGGVVIALGVTESFGLPGRALIVAFVLCAPALAIARLLPSAGTAVALIVGAAGATAINVAVEQSMLSAELWSPTGGVIAVGLVTALLRLWPRPAIDCGMHRRGRVAMAPVGLGAREGGK